MTFGDLHKLVWVGNAVHFFEELLESTRYKGDIRIRLAAAEILRRL
jgi:hypothetical protein